MPKVSIILPVYNVEKYILTCVMSIVQQSYKNIEIIIVDDCGIDNSMKIIEEYLNTLHTKDFIHIIRHEFNKGVSAARNTGINHATGEFIFFIDSDDYISFNCIESFIRIAKKHPIVDIIFGSAEYAPYKWKDSIIAVNSDYFPEFVQDTNWICKHFFKKKQIFPITAWNKLINKNYIIKNNLFFKEAIIYEDNLWNWRIGNTVKSIAFNKNITYYYRYVSNSIVNKPYNKKNMESETIIIREMSKSITPRYFFSKLIRILHFSHSSYCKRQGNKKLQPSIIRYPLAFIFYLKCIFNLPINY